MEGRVVSDEDYEARLAIAKTHIPDIAGWWASHAPACSTHRGEPCDCGYVLVFSGARSILAIDPVGIMELQALH